MQMALKKETVSEKDNNNIQDNFNEEENRCE